jgi:hypothetical protein
LAPLMLVEVAVAVVVEQKSWRLLRHPLQDAVFVPVVAVFAHLLVYSSFDWWYSPRVQVENPLLVRCSPGEDPSPSEGW